LHASHGYTLWPTEQLASTNIIRLTRQLNTDLSSLTWPTKDSPNDFWSSLPSLSEYRTTAFQRLDALCNDDIIATRHFMHGRQRKDFRLKLSYHSAITTEQWELGQRRKVYSSLLEKTSPSIDFTNINAVDGTPIVGIHDVHHELTSHYNKHHSSPAHHSDRNYDDIFASKASFLRELQRDNIPQPLLDTIWDSINLNNSFNIHNVPLQDAVSAVRARLSLELSPTNPPSFHDFQIQLALCNRKGKSGGMSMCTYSMLYFLDHTIQKRLYDALVIQ
jgi:hypothetical protein